MELNAILQSGQQLVELVAGSAGAAAKIGELVKRSGGDGERVREAADLAAELTNQLLQAKSAQLTLVNQLLELKATMIEEDRRFELQRRYEPVETPAGALVLQLKTEESRGEPSHYICPDCAEKGLRSFLQPQGTGKRCNPCDKFIPFEPDRPYEPPRVRTRRIV
ncbi:hypothetical protein ACXN5S_12455 [Pseudoroseicyclus sp. H15]